MIKKIKFIKYVCPECFTERKVEKSIEEEKQFCDFCKCEMEKIK